MNELPLRDIHLPDAVSWWPPAIGWWLLPLVLLAIAFTVYQLAKYKKNRRKQPAYKKIALSELEKIRQIQTEDNLTITQLRAISTLLRRIALSYLPRETVASLTGEHWITQLNDLTEDTFFSNELGSQLASAPYKEQVNLNTDELIDICEQWINQLPDHANNENQPQ